MWSYIRQVLFTQCRFMSSVFVLGIIWVHRTHLSRLAPGNRCTPTSLIHHWKGKFMSTVTKILEDFDLSLLWWKQSLSFLILCQHDVNFPVIVFEGDILQYNRSEIWLLYSTKFSRILWVSNPTRKLSPRKLFFTGKQSFREHCATKCF